MLDPVGVADHVEAHRPETDRVPVSGLPGELDAVIGENGVNPVGNCLEQVLEELPGRPAICLLHEPGDRGLAGPVDAHEELELALDRLRLGDVDADEADRVAPEPLAPGLVAVRLRQARDAMPPEAPVQREAGQVRNRGLQGIEAVVQRQQYVTPERDDHRLPGLGQDGGTRIPRSGL